MPTRRCVGDRIACGATVIYKPAEGIFDFVALFVEILVVAVLKFAILCRVCKARPLFNDAFESPRYRRPCPVRDFGLGGAPTISFAPS